MEILEQQADRFYPEDYLLSRLRNRRARYRALIAGASAESAWAKLLSEYRWVYFQMNCRMRRLYEPLFLYNEINTIIFCIRNKMYEGRDIGPLLVYSMISKELKETLRGCSSLSSCVEVIEDFFLGLSPEFSGLTAIYASRGLTGFEKTLRNRFLKYAEGTAEVRIIRDFFTALIDIRNLLILQKHIRWEAKDDPVFISGGTISHDMLKKATDERGIGKLAGLVTKKKGRSFDSAGLEIMLLDWMTASINKSVGDPLDTGNIINHLWRCYIETVNLGTMFYGAGLGSEILEKELLQ